MKKEIYFVTKTFFIWRIITFFYAYIAVKFIPIFGENFFGGKLINYNINPLFWAWSNFDGEHFASIAIYGYKSLQQFYFPFYPIMIRFFTTLVGNDLSDFVLSGIIISNISLFLALLGLYKLALFDYPQNAARMFIFLILAFPTSFYFGAVYSESLFLALVTWSVYLFRSKRFLLSSLLAMLASSTRIIGIAIFFAYFANIFLDKKHTKFLYSIFIIPVGILSYMYYLSIYWGGFSKMYKAFTVFGEQRSDNLVLLPQVFYRYFFKIIPNINWSYWPTAFTIILEILVALLFAYLLIFSFNRIRWDYWIYSVISYLTPTISGSFSSMPRYVILIFPLFMFVSSRLILLNKSILVVIFVILNMLLAVTEFLFVRGHFVS